MDTPVSDTPAAAPAAPAAPATADQAARWDDARRLESWAGEIRVNAVRVGVLAAFYGHHLAQLHLLNNPGAGGEYHRAVTLIVSGWAVFVVGLHRALQARYFPGWLKYAALLVDLALVTLTVMASGGPKSSLVILYPIVVASSALRLSLGLVWAGTAGALGLYLAVVVWVIRTAPERRVEHADQIIFMMGVLAVGALAGQMVRQARRLVEGLAAEVEEAP